MALELELGRLAAGSVDMLTRLMVVGYFLQIVRKRLIMLKHLLEWIIF